MIYTVTLNPAIDVFLNLGHPYRMGKINRAEKEIISIGGKGINVSRVLKALGCDNVAFTLIGGPTGKAVEDFLKKENIKSDCVRINGNTRINVKINHQESIFETTQFNAPGPEISRDDILNLAKKLAKVKKGDIVIVSGGFPKTLSLNLFDNFVKFLSSRGVSLVIDLYGTPLLKIVRYKPFLVNVNEIELADTFYSQVKNENDCIKGAKRLLKLGAQNVIVTRGAEGAILINDQMVMKVKPLKGEAKNTVGAGDSLLAGFIDEYLKTKSFDLAIKKGVLVSCATVFSGALANEKAIADLSNKKSKGGTI